MSLLSALRIVSHSEKLSNAIKRAPILSEHSETMLTASSGLNRLDGINGRLGLDVSTGSVGIGLDLSFGVGFRFRNSAMNHERISKNRELV